MGVGQDLGEQLRQWLTAEPDSLRQSRSLANRLIDIMGANDSLNGPVRVLERDTLLSLKRLLPFRI